MIVDIKKEIKELFIYHFREKLNKDKDTEIINKFEENLS